MSTDTLYTGGYWSTYWYNGRLYGAEIMRGIDVFRLTPSEHLSEAEIRAAEAVMMDEFNAQLQPRVEWEPSVDVAQAYLDQMVRANRILKSRAQETQRVLSGNASAMQLNDVAASLEADVALIEARELGGDAERMAKLAAVLRGMAAQQ